MASDIHHNLTRPTGFDCVLHVRCSVGFEVSEVYGCVGGAVASAGGVDMSEIRIPAVDCDKTLSVELRMTGDIPSGAACVLQCAMLFTNSSGERRLRIHTTCPPATASAATLFKYADVESLLAFLCKSCTRESGMLGLLMDSKLSFWGRGSWEGSDGSSGGVWKKD